MPQKKSKPKAGEMEIVDVRQFKGLNTIDDPISLDPGESPMMINMDILRTGSLQCRYGYGKYATLKGTGPGRGLLTYYKTVDTNDAIDQSATGGANTYTPPVAISETAPNRITFTPTKPNIARIGVWIVAKGTGNWYAYLHDAANVQLAVQMIPNGNLTDGAYNYFDIPYTWTAGALHVHIVSSIANGTVKTSVAGDLSTAAYQEIYGTKGDYLMLFHNDGHAYYVSNTVTTPVDLGSFGVDSPMTRGTILLGKAIFGNGKNLVMQWPGFGSIGTLSASTPTRASIFGTFDSRLFINDPFLGDQVWMSAKNDLTTWTGVDTSEIPINYGDGWKVSGMVANNDYLQVYKEDSIHGIAFTTDPSTGVANIPQAENLVSSQGGAFATGSLQAVYGYTYYLSKKGFEAYGPSVFRVTANQTLPLSLKIDPTVKQVNFRNKDTINSVFTPDLKYICAVPMGTNAVNNYILVYNENVKRRLGYENWVPYTNVPAHSFAVFRDANLIDQVYFLSHTDSNLYKFNTTFSDNGFGYDRIWQSKTFQFGERTHWQYIDIEGSMTEDCVIYIDLYTDGVEIDGTDATSQKIDSKNLLLSSSGDGYIGDDYIGSAYEGSALPGVYTSTIPLYKFKKRIWFPPETNLGYNMWFRLRNQAENHGWKLSRYRMAYTQDPDVPTYGLAD